MIQRNLLKKMRVWGRSPGRKPLVLRGARQVGKTTLIHEFAKDFDQYIYLNLELPEDRRSFESFANTKELVQSIFFLKNKELEKKRETLLFIDEIQAYPEAVGLLRYFYEEEPELAVVAAGSALENLFDKSVSFPVGRVQYLFLRPVSFPEFLDALGEQAAVKQLQKIPIADFAHEKLLKLFHLYTLIGGMPEMVAHYAANKDLTALRPLYDALINSYLDDAEKYASTKSQLQIIRHVLRAAFSMAGKRIKFQGFGNSSYGSREVGESLRTLQKALLLNIVYPETGYQLPFLPDLKKSPRLHLLDTGLVNYVLGIQQDLFGTDDLNKIQEGLVLEHIVGQELLAERTELLDGLHFWVREKKTSQAELDYVVSFEGKVIPIEVKSGAAGTLRSLHQFMDASTHDLAIRFYSGKLHLGQAVTPSGKTYRLLSLPYYLVSQTQAYLYWMQQE